MRKPDFMRWGRLFITAIIVGSFSVPPQTMAAEKKLTKKQKAANSRWLSPAPSPVPFMKFDELAKLEHTQRLKYVRALRQSAREIEKMQFMFRDSRRKNASLEQQNWQRLYAFLISEPAEAQTEPVGDTGHRGRKPGDQCIYGYNLSNYPTDGKRQPFECTLPMKARCAGGGVRCGDFLSGLGAGLVDNCISDASKHIATQLCDKKRENLSKNPKYASEANDAFEDAKKFYGFTDANPVLTKEEMVNGEATKILDNLAKHAYDDRIYAMLIYVLGLYKKNLVTPPIRSEVTDKTYANLLNPEYFENNLTDVQTAINQVFSNYLSHCNSDVPDAEIDAITDPNWVKKYRGSSMETGRGLEAERIEAAIKYKSQGGSKKVEDITEIPECRAIRARIAGITNSMNNIRGSYPVPTGPAPPPLPPGQSPPEQIIAEPNPKPTGCSTNVTNEHDLLPQAAARCMICMADRAVAMTANQKDLSTEEKMKRENYGTSTKWMSLLSTMALACGEGFDGASVGVEVMDKYRMIFGHCNRDTYKWDEATPLTDEDRKLVREWASGEKWSGKKKWDTNTADINSNFARIYGVGYETATKMFCNPKRFNEGFLSGKIRSIKDPKKLTEDDKKFDAVNIRREQFLSFFDGIKTKDNLEAGIKPEKNVETVADDLFSCMKESQKTAREIYSENSSGCTNNQEINGTHKKNMGDMIKSVKAGGASVMYNKGSCLVSAQIERDTKNPGLENIGFAHPSELTQKPDMYRLLYDDKIGTLPILAFDDDQVAKHNAGGRHKICSQTNTLMCEDLDNYSFLYPSPGFCAVASQNKQQSGEAGKSK